jgi:hypothetical protein
LGINFQEDMLQIPQVGSSLGDDNKSLLWLKKDNANSYKKGGLTSEELSICQDITESNMDVYGYQIEKNIKSNIFVKTFLYITFPIKLFFAVLLNIGRVKNLRETIKRRLK